MDVMGGILSAEHVKILEKVEPNLQCNIGSDIPSRLRVSQLSTWNQLFCSFLPQNLRQKSGVHYLAITLA